MSANGQKLMQHVEVHEIILSISRLRNIGIIVIEDLMIIIILIIIARVKSI